MDSKMACYHIRWSDSHFDWECHGTREEAEQSAKQLARVHESFTIVEFDKSDGTPPCPSANIKEKRASRWDSA